MASMFIKHRVADFDAWKKVFDEHEATRRESTVTGHSVHRDTDDPNVVTLAFRVTDLARAKDFATSDNLREIMQRAGVEGPPDIWYTEDVEDKTY